MSFESILSLAAIAISVAGLIHTFKKGKITKSIELQQYLDEAWDLMGGENGASKISHFANENNFILAERALQKALAHDRNNPQANYVLGTLNEAKNDLQGAESAYIKCIRLSKGKKINAFHNLARMYIKQGKTKEALNLYTQAFQNATDPHQKSESMFNIGVTYLEMARTDLAIASFEKALQVDRGCGLAYANLIAIYGIQGEYGRCEKHIEDAVNAGANDSEIFENAAALYQRIGDKERFDKMYNKYISMKGSKGPGTH